MTDDAVIHCLGRLAVDLYGEQRGTNLTETRSFRRFVGGTSANLAVGLARLGRRARLVSATGDDPMGAYLRSALGREGVDLSALRVDPARRTALAFLALGGAEVGGIDFHRHDAADAAVGPKDVPADALAPGAVLALAGSHLVGSEALADQLLSGAGRLVLDVDLRRPIWQNVAGGMPAATARLRRVAAACAVVVGNEDELRALGGRDDLAGATRAVRDLTGALIVLKTGAAGAIAFEGAVPERLEDGLAVPAPAVPVLNPVGAGDAFLAGFLDAWTRGLPTAEALRRGNACGALVASRQGCSDAAPYRGELEAFLACGDALDPGVSRLHRLGGRLQRPARVLALACDHRAPFRALMASHGRSADDVARFKALVARAARRVAQEVGIEGAGLLMDATFGGAVLEEMDRRGWWLARPVEVTRSRPLAFEADQGGDLAFDVASWHPAHVAKCLIWHAPDDPADLVEAQIAALRRLQAACRGMRIEWMLEVIAPEVRDRGDEASLRSVAQLYDAGLEPDWWKLPAFGTAEAWRGTAALLAARDPGCRGVVVLGLDGPAEEVAASLRLAGSQEACAGFAVGRTIFGAPARAWFAGEIDDAAAVDRIAAGYRRMVEAFSGAEGRAAPARAAE